MTNCSQGPNDSSGCEQEVLWVNGVPYSKHYEPSHWSRMKRGTAKPKAPKPSKEPEPLLAFSTGVTDEEAANFLAKLEKPE